MAITPGMLIEMTLWMDLTGSRAANVWQYEVVSAVVPATAEEVAAAWWAAVKGVYRATAVVTGGRQFRSVAIRELNNPVGELAEYAIPAADGDGTRAAGTLGSYLPTANAMGVRLAVSSRLTRPGQKRLNFLTEGDVFNNDVGAGFISLAEDLMNVMTADISLPSPALATLLDPIVCRKDVTGAVTANQPVIGYVVNPVVTTQTSRRAGRGI